MKDKLIVKEIDYNEQGRISGLVIYNATKRTDCFSYFEGKVAKPAGKKAAEKVVKEPENTTLPEETRVQLEQVLKENGIFLETIRHLYKVNDLTELTQKKAENILGYIPDILLTQRKSELKALINEKNLPEEKVCEGVHKAAIKDLTIEETNKLLIEVRKL